MKKEERKKAYMKEYRQRPEVKERQKQYHQTPEIKEKVKQYNQRPEVKKRKIEYINKYRKTPEYKEKRAKRKLAQYNLTLHQYNQMVKKQNCKCSICGKKELAKSLAVDHCHKTNTVRGLLCQKCNRGLGFFQDDPVILKNAIKYLKS